MSRIGTGELRSGRSVQGDQGISCNGAWDCGTLDRIGQNGGSSLTKPGKNRSGRRISEWPGPEMPWSEMFVLKFCGPQLW